MENLEHLSNMSPDDELDYRLAEMKRSTKRPPDTRPKIQRVANDLRNRKDFRSHYLPKVVSMGPIHHGNPELQIGERNKLIWAQLYIERAGYDPKLVYKAIADNLAELMSLIDDNVITMFIDNIGTFRTIDLDRKLTWMLFVDGCSLMYILNMDNPFEMGDTTMKLVSRDVLLLENQLPFMLLKLLERDEKILNAAIKSFLGYNHVGGYDRKQWEMLYKDDDRALPEEVVVLSDREPSHLLDLLRNKLLPYSTFSFNKFSGEWKMPERNNVVRYMNIQELRSNGIRIKSNKRPGLSVMSFYHRFLHGELTLPTVVLDDITVSTFLNLRAFEMCPDFKNDYAIGTFVEFINSMVRLPEDVKDLRSAGVLLSNYGSDEELVKLFHFIATDVVYNAGIYSPVYAEINKHIKDKWKTNTVRFLSYIRHPWTNFVVHATELALALTFIQTWFTVHSAKS